MTTHKPGQRGRPPRKCAPLHQPSKTIVSIGNCRVNFPKSSVCSSDAEGLRINISDPCTIDIKVTKEILVPLTGYSFTLLNPNNLEGHGKLLLEDVLKLYNRELPAMKYAANTGKESRFLENCLNSGKYCTLILRNSALELIGAVTYQMLPTDTNQAELPLAAVAQAHHRKGFGACLYKELERRLLDVGVLSIFCWADQESEAFWAKQGFVTVAEVDGRGKPWKLPIKADLRRAMSIPGSAILMISYLSFACTPASLPGPPAPYFKSHEMTSGIKTLPETCKGAMETSPNALKSILPNKETAGQKFSPPPITTPLVFGESKSSHVSSTTPGQAVGDIGRWKSSTEKFCASITPLNMEGMLSIVASEDTKMTASNPSAPSPAKSKRPPFADTTNTRSPNGAANRPLKKRPFTRGGLTRAASKSVEAAVARQGVKADGAQCLSQLKVPPSGPKGKFGRRAVGVHNKTQLEETSEKFSEVPEASKIGHCESFSEERTGGKRGREAAAQKKQFGRPAIRRRKDDPVPNIQSAEGPEKQESKLMEKSRNTLVEDGVQHMFDLLLPQQVTRAGGCFEESASLDGQDLTSTLIRTSVTNSGDYPIAHAEVQRRHTCRTEAEATGTSVDAPGHHRSAVESNGSQGSPKVPLERINSCGAGQLPLKKTNPVIMFMNMADENQKKRLTKYVERLSGTVTSDGCKCTHVVTGEVRRTLNFCVAISSGAWILTPDWLKTSVKQRGFADEALFVLRDRTFEAKYNVSLHDVICRAKQRPNLLLDGMHIYPTPHIHPPVDTISQIVAAAGGKVLNSIEEALQLEDKSHTAAVAAEEDMSEAISTAKAGIQTFSSDWLLTCIVKQDLDLTAIQFSESL